MLELAAEGIGHLARVATVSEFDQLQSSYLPTALGWLQDARSDLHRLSGALVVRQLALHSPEIIFAKRRALFDALWTTVADRNALVCYPCVNVLMSFPSHTSHLTPHTLHRTSPPFYHPLPPRSDTRRSAREALLPSRRRWCSHPRERAWGSTCLCP